MRKRIVALFIVLIFVISFASLSYAAEYWASKNSNKYHFPSCKWAQRINPKNLVVFKSAESALKSGNIPCRVCKPPIKD